MAKRRCLNCRCRFSPLLHVPNQQYCSKRECQKARKNQWKNKKLKNDPDYRANQHAAQNKWQSNHGDYWKRYKTNHPRYVKHNREQCKMQARKKRQQSKLTLNLGFDEVFVKIDALTEINTDKTVGYKPILVPETEFVKIDVLFEEIVYLSSG
jgi:hypothetical protein